MLTEFVNFIASYYNNTEEMTIFVKLADNGSYGCKKVVGADARKWGHFQECWGRDQCTLVGGTESENLEKRETPTRPATGGAGFIAGGVVPGVLILKPDFPEKHRRLALFMGRE